MQALRWSRSARPETGEKIQRVDSDSPNRRDLKPDAKVCRKAGGSHGGRLFRRGLFSIHAAHSAGYGRFSRQLSEFPELEEEGGQRKQKQQAASKLSLRYKAQVFEHTPKHSSGASPVCVNVSWE